MGNRLFGVDVAGLVARHVGPGVLPVVLTEPKRAGRDPLNPSGGKQALPPALHNARGFWEDFTGLVPPDVLAGDRKAVLIGDTLPAGVVPAKGWMVSIEGKTLRVERLLSRDPAAALYVYLCRDVKGPDGV
jgi:hypothetical protein